MRALTRRTRRIAVAVAGIAAACTLAASPAAAQTATGSYTPNSHQWYFSEWGVQQDVWPVTEGSGVIVAVVDGGVQASIPDLQGVVESGTDELGKPGHGETDYTANGGHGTAVASLIAGQGTNNGPVGIAPQAKILPVDVFTSDGGITPVANGIKYAADHSAQVINISLGYTAPSATSCDPQLQSAVNYALARNVVIVASSGDVSKNGQDPQEPGTCAGVLTVGGVEPDGSLWSGSTEGPYVSVAAPGDRLFTVSSNGQQYSTDSNGTSFSAPLVAAAAALIKSKNPSMPWYTVAQRLTDTAIAQGPVPNNGTGYGIININKALNSSVSASAPNPVYARYQAYLKSTGQSAGTGTQPTISAAPTSSGSSGAAVIGIIVVIIVLAVIGAIIILVRRNSRKGPRNPGGGTGYPPGGAYGPPPGQYPGQPGQYPSPPGQSQYPPSGGYRR